MRKERGNMKNNCLDPLLSHFVSLVTAFVTLRTIVRKSTAAFSAALICNIHFHVIMTSLIRIVQTPAVLAAIVFLIFWLFIDHVIFSSIQVVRDVAIFESSREKITTIRASTKL